ncbi:hypothetical protein K402DRAFT_297775, partial [Aulographum hederae CBS 113979]
KPIVLEQPAKFTPPSHGRALPKKKRPMQYGPKIGEEEREAMKGKQYPHMMPPEGTVMHRVLTSRGLHLWVSLSVLTSLAFYTFLQNFLHTTPFRHLLPSRALLTSSPLEYLSQFFQVYKMHIEHVSQETAEKRKRAVEDAERRKEYRRRHGEEGVG